MRPVGWGRLALLLAILPALGLGLAALGPTGWWPATLAAHWAPHLAVLCLPLWCWQGRRPAVGAILLALHTQALWPHLAAAHAPRAAAPGPGAATAMVANLYYGTRDHAAALAGLDGELVALIETVPADRARLRADPRWPHQRWVQPPAFGGCALLSRWPLHATELDLDQAWGLDARVQAPWGQVRVIVLHTRSPGDAAGLAANRRQLAELAGLAETEPGPLLVLGDLNATPGDPALRALYATGLRPPHDGRPRTWPAWLGPAGISIDHALGRGLALGGAAVVPLPGSDHRGLRVRFAP